MKDALNYANLIQNVENIGKLNQKNLQADLQSTGRQVSGQDHASVNSYSLKAGAGSDNVNMNFRGAAQLPSANQDEKN